MLSELFPSLHLIIRYLTVFLSYLSVDAIAPAGRVLLGMDQNHAGEDANDLRSMHDCKTVLRTTSRSVSQRKKGLGGVGPNYQGKASRTDETRVRN